MDTEKLLKGVLAGILSVGLLIVWGLLMLEEGAARKTPPPTVCEQAYIIARDKGSSLRLKGRCLLMHVFVDSKTTERWDAKSRTDVFESIVRVKNWCRKRSNEFGVYNIEFISEIVDAGKNFVIKHTTIPDFYAQQAYLRFWLDALLYDMGYDTWNELVRDKRGEYGVDNVSLIIHVNVSGRSYAYRVMYSEIYGTFANTDMEFCVVFFKDTMLRRDTHPHACAHEMMHLFGADDLYRIDAAKNYHYWDIMNAGQANLEYNTVSPLTAYSVGWTDDKPDIKMFKVIEE